MLHSAPADPALTEEDVAGTSRPHVPAGGGHAGELVLALSLAAAIALGFGTALVSLLGRSEGTELAGYLAVAAAAGLGVLFARRLAGRAGDRLEVLAAVNALGVATILLSYWTLLLAFRFPGLATLTALVLTVALLALNLFWLRRPAALGVLARLPSPGTATAGVIALAACLLPFSPAPAQSSVKLLAATVFGAAIAAALMAARRGLPRPLRIAVDVVFCLLLALVVSDLQYHPDSSPANDVLHHLNFYVGPVNDVIHGRAVLVDTFSQYGVGVIYAIAGGYQLAGAKLSYGSFELAVGVLTALWFCAIYLLLRLTTRSQVIAIGAVVVAVLWNVFNSYSFTSYPMAGVLRFGPPFLVVLALALQARRGGRQWPAVVLAALVSLWSIETFTYALGAVLSYLACAAWLRGGTLRDRLRRLLVDGVAPLAAATLAVQLAFALATRLAAGHWPDWGTYLEFLKIYGTSDFGKLLIAPFSAGLAHAGILLASTVAVIVLSLRASDLRPWTRAQLPIIAALTGVGIVTYTYYLGRSAEGLQAKILLPAIVLIAIWTDIALRNRRSGARLPRLAFGAIACGVALLLAISASPSLVELHRDKAGQIACGPQPCNGWRQTALAALLHKAEITPPSDARALLGRTFAPGLRGHVQKLSASPVASAFDPEQAAERLLRRYSPDRDAAVLLGPEMTTEVLVRSGRVNALPIATPTEDALIPAAFSRISAAAARLPSGTVLISERGPLAGQAGEPAAELLDVIRAGQAKYLSLRVRLLADLRARFRLRTLATDRSGVVAVELTRRSSSTPPDRPSPATSGPEAVRAPIRSR